MAPFELLLLRHGIAQDRGAGLPDDRRALTPEGRRRTAQVVERLVALELGCSHILSSPLVRARQTAEIAREGGLAAGLDLATELAPQGDPLPLLRHWLSGGGPLSAGQRLALVGHEPDLSLLAARLCGAPAGALRLKKAGVALLELPALAAAAAVGQGCLTLLLTPRCLLRST